MKARAALLLFMLGAAGCGYDADPNQPTGFIQIKGSDTLVNAEQMLAEEFMKSYPQVFVAITGGGSGVGIASLINRSCDVAAASREMKPKEIAWARQRGVFPKEITVAFDGVAVIVHRNNPIEKLTLAELHDIFTGKVARWNALGGKDLPIVTLSREVSSGTYAYFKEQIIHLGRKDGAEEFSSRTLLLTSSQTIVEEVASNESAIGYLGMGYLSERVKTVRIGQEDQFWPADLANVLSKKYPLSRPLYFYTNGEPAGVTRLFLDFTLSPQGRQLLTEAGFVPLQNHVPTKNN